MTPKDKKKHVLVTGGAGFIGSNFIPYFLGTNPNAHIVNLDKLTYAGTLENLEQVEKSDRYSFVKGDIRDVVLVDKLFEKYCIEAVIHFAAESHVDNSIKHPENFIKTNIEGTFVLLEAARKKWLEKAHVPRKGFEAARFHQISTDEVYGSLGDDGFFTEEMPYAPNSPYSASKASSDFLVRSYFHTYGLNVVTSNCSNNYGPKQHDEKLIPTIIRKALSNESIPIYGDGKNVRDWLFVEDHCKGIEKVFNEGKAGETYLIGGSNEINNLTIAKKICSILDGKQPRPKGKYEDFIHFTDDRPGHDWRYAIDATKVKTELNWSAKESFDSGLKKTIAWYSKKYQKV